ncbi:cell division cycle protein 27 homolog B [Impatiens glandulifera]|uniref:cell division cycle protein 27 homolog B n=1 Tax=Impatiens glandulifera TaxID=253017 RepID=UPI001FB0E3EA|nr:cell division cycle protein 27 homolog B [Impatiens glandulifera]
MEAILVDCVQNSLRHFTYKNAIFMCERLCAEFPSETNLQLLAACYLQNNQAYSAYYILKGTLMAQSRYLFALSCFQMDLLVEAEAALCPANEPGAEVPNGASGHYLLARIYRYTDRRKSAIHHFKQALTLDPLLWVAYEELCILGAAEDATLVFGEAAALCLQKQQLDHLVAEQNSQAAADDHNIILSRNFGLEDLSQRQVKPLTVNNIRDIPGNYYGAVTSGGTASQSLNGAPAGISFYNTPSPMSTQLSGIAPPPVGKLLQHNGPNPNSTSTDGAPRSTVNSTFQAPRRKFVDEGKLRKISGRLFPDSGPRRSSRLAGDAVGSNNSSTSGVSGNGTNHSSKGVSKLNSVTFRSVTIRKGQSWNNEHNISEGMRQDSFDDSQTSLSTSSCNMRTLEQELSTMPMCEVVSHSSKVSTGTAELLDLLKVLGEGFRLSCIYRCQDALDTFLRLPPKHYNTGWVLSQVGKLNFELVDYLEADRTFSLARLASPYALEGMDIYSTVLFHLKKDMKLSYLAQELTSTDRLSPQSWCALGNCYSLQKDHETALKIFQRATHLNPRFTYAYTLCGHEYVLLEDFENGIKSYQSALRIDARHYNAWYGLGMIYLRQEKLDFSEHHFHMAFQINPCSSVIMCYLGIAFHGLKRNDEALKMMDKSILADKKNPVPMYHKARILVSMERFDDALNVLDELKEYAPHESSVYALMGKIYERRNAFDMAMLHFGFALDLKPPATDVATIKAAIEKMHVPDELDGPL